MMNRYCHGKLMLIEMRSAWYKTIVTIQTFIINCYILLFEVKILIITKHCLYLILYEKETQFFYEVVIKS